MIDFGPTICSDPVQSGPREWLVTNGLDGLLIAAAAVAEALRVTETVIEHDDG